MARTRKTNKPTEESISVSTTQTVQLTEELVEEPVAVESVENKPAEQAQADNPPPRRKRGRPPKNQTAQERNGADLSFLVDGKNLPAISFGAQPNGNAKKEGAIKVDFNGFYEIANLLNQTVGEVVENCYIIQLKKLMSKIGKVVVRYNLDKKEIANVLYNGKTLGLKEILLSPIFLEGCISVIDKDESLNQNIYSVIDFPYGESSKQSKVVNLKECASCGVDGATVTLANMLFEEDKFKELKGLIKAISRFRDLDVGVSVSAMDLNADQIKLLFKLVGKYKINHVTFVFGNVTAGVLKQKVAEITENKCKKELRVLANVDTIHAVDELLKLGVDVILTPYADNIGKELIKKFNIKSLKLR